jgi:sugar phosphate isomerase/epimerase
MIDHMFGLPEISDSCFGYLTPERIHPRAAIDAIAALGVRGITLDAARSGLRPRELGRSARRDLAALLRRHELEFTGLDLWVPPEHFTTPSTAQRAMDAVGQALDMVGELAPLVGGRSQPVVSVLLPTDLNPQARATLGDMAQRHGATLADHALIVDDQIPTPGIGVGIDPVFYLTDGSSPAKAITRAGTNLASARLSDTTAMGRCVIGASGSKLDLTAYAGALIVSGQDWVTLDVREMPEPSAAVAKSIEAWRDAGTL